MANGTTRTALSVIEFRNGKGQEELNEEMKLEKGSLPKFPLKNVKHKQASE